MVKKLLRPPSDVNQLAKAIVDLSTQEEGAPASSPPPKKRKNPHAVALGRRGGLKGGKARAAKLTPEERREAAKKAIAVRWAKRGRPE